MKILRVFYVYCIVVTILTISSFANNRNDLSWEDITLKNFKSCSEANSVFAKYNYLDGIGKKEIQCKEGQKLILKYEIKNMKGELILSIKNPEKKEIWSFSIKDVEKNQKEMVIDKTGIYTIGLNAVNTSGSFNISWEVKNNESF